MRLALAGDTMLGRNVAPFVADGAPLWSPEVVEAVAEADYALCNLECCISDRGAPWPDPSKPFFFRAPPEAAEALAGLGVDAVTLANNHALDYGAEALLDTVAHLDRVGVAHVGAGGDAATARRPLTVDVRDTRLTLVGFADHPRDFAADDERAGIAFAPLDRGLPGWVGDAIQSAQADVVLVTPHWGPNMTAEPVAAARSAAPALVAAGARLVAGHSAHCFHGVTWIGDALVCYDLGDFIDDYAVNPQRRNDLGLLWLVDVDGGVPHRVEAVPLFLDYCFTRLAVGEEAEWIERRFRAACASFGVRVTSERGRLVVER